jgi:hypothetical protein
MLRARTPFRCWVEGLIAGAIGAGVQTIFFRATASIAPKPAPDAYQPPEREQQGEIATQTVARRVAEGLAQRGPLEGKAKERAGNLVHYGFGAAWGGLYGLLRASHPSLRGPLGVIGFSSAVWMAGDNIILPAFRLGGLPHRYSLRSHAYALAAHLAYGAGVAGTLTLADHLDAVAGLTVLAAGRGLIAGRRGLELGRRAVSRTQALVPQQVIEGPRKLVERIAREVAARRP